MKGQRLWIISIFLVFSILVVTAYILSDVALLSRALYTLKETETFAVPSNNKVPFTNITSVVIVAPDDTSRKVSATRDPSQCRESCVYDDNCKAFTFDSVKNECRLHYSINGFERNKNGLFTTSGGIKLRPFIGSNEADKKHLRYEGMELPAHDAGRISLHRFVQDVNECKTKCLEANDPANRCIAFEYDFKNKTCALNSSVQGKINPSPDKDTYILIN